MQCGDIGSSLIVFYSRVSAMQSKATFKISDTRGCGSTLACCAAVRAHGYWWFTVQSSTEPYLPSIIERMFATFRQVFYLPSVFLLSCFAFFSFLLLCCVC